MKFSHSSYLHDYKCTVSFFNISVTKHHCCYNLERFVNQRPVKKKYLLLSLSNKSREIEILR